MINGLYLSAAGMLPRINQMSNVSNNLANVSTNGYKKSNIFLRQLIDASYALDHAMGIERQQAPEDVRIDFTQGTFEKTNNPFDLALNGSGFLRVRDNAGEINYTRNGRFYQDPNGFLVTGSGMFLLSDVNNVLRIDGDEVDIMGNGDIVIDGVQTDTIGIAEFDNADYTNLYDIGMGLFKKPAAVNEILPNPDAVLYQGYLEDSNVEPVKTMVDMIELFRAFELGQKAIQIQDQSLQRVVTEVGVIR
ncbi:flagellar hook-basal body protein [Candidatus Latescibacterota bacterium]